MSVVRKITVAAVFVLVAISLATHIGTGTLSAIGYESIALICPVGALEVMLGARDFMLHPLILFIAVVVLVLIFGKVFCAWFCPTPMLQALFRRSKKKDAKDAAKASKGEGAAADDTEDGAESAKTLLAEQDEKSGDDAAVEDVIPADAQISAEVSMAMAEAKKEAHNGAGCSHGCASCSALKPLGGKRDGFHLDTRFAVLGGALASAAVFGFPVFCLACPIGLTFATFIGLWHLVQFNETSWGLLIFPIILILELVVFRKWCHKLCPISALLSLISNGNKTFVPKVNEDKCLRSKGIDCHACVEACPEDLDPHAKSIPECSKCGRCKEVCPANAITFPLFSARRGAEDDVGALPKEKSEDAACVS